jgi:hypothetical protein
MIVEVEEDEVDGGAEHSRAIVELSCSPR